MISFSYCCKVNIRCSLVTCCSQNRVNSYRLPSRITLLIHDIKVRQSQFHERDSLLKSVFDPICGMMQFHSSISSLISLSPFSPLLLKFKDRPNIACGVFLKGGLVTCVRPANIYQKDSFFLFLPKIIFRFSILHRLCYCYRLRRKTDQSSSSGLRTAPRDPE